MKRLITIVVCIFFFGWLAGTLLDYRYKKFWNPVFEKLDMVFKDTTKQQVVFLGDSRVLFGINPYYTDSITSLKTFNAGMGAASVLEIHMLATAWLDKHPAPDLFVISIGNSGLLQSSQYLGNPSYYFYYMDVPLVKDALSEQGYHTNLIGLFPILKYTTFDEYNKISILRSYSDGFLKPGGITYKGFINNPTNLFNLQSLEDNDKNLDTAYTAGMNKYKNLFDLFNKHKCKCLLVYPPTFNYTTIQNSYINADSIHAARNKLNKTIDSAIIKVSDTYRIPILHFDKDSAFTNAMFSDETHVNISGSILYSKKLGQAIKLLLTKNAGH
jgi:hypothetical protein